MSGTHRAQNAGEIRILGIVLNDSWRRTIRTVVQLLLALIPALPTLALLTEGHPPTQAALATLIVWGAAVTKANNWLEDHVSWWPALLKAPASDGANPAPDTQTDGTVLPGGGPTWS